MALLCVQRILHAENQDYDYAVGGVTRHYVRVMKGGTPLQRAVHELLEAHIYMIDLSCPSEYPEAARNAVGTIERMFVASVSEREERTADHRRKRHQSKEAPVVEELDERVWAPEFARAALRFGEPTLVVQFCDDTRFQARINAYIDDHGESVDGDDDDEEEEDDDDDEEEDGDAAEECEVEGDDDDDDEDGEDEDCKIVPATTKVPHKYRKLHR